MRRAALACGVAALLFFAAFPFAWMIATAFKPSHEIFVSPPTLFPSTYTLDNLAHLFQQTRFTTYLANRVLVASSTVLLSADELKTLPVGIADLHNASVVDWGMIMSAGMLVLVPVLIVFVIVQRYLVAGWGAGGVKG